MSSTTRWKARSFFILVHADEGAVAAGKGGGFYLSISGRCRGPLGVHRRRSGWAISHRVIGMRLIDGIKTQREAFRIADELIEKWGPTLRKPKDTHDVDAIYHSRDSIELSRYLKQLQEAQG
jgi:hypothetical protein